MSEARSQSDTPPCVVGEDTAEAFAIRRRMKLPFTGELTSGWSICYQENQQQEHTPLSIMKAKVFL